VSDRNERLKLALDELRMQMLGAQVLFGFQFQALFQERFQEPSDAQRLASALGFGAILLTIGVLIAATAHHRLRERGEATLRMLAIVERYAAAALVTLAITLAADIYLVTVGQWGNGPAIVLTVCALACCVLFWYALGVMLRRREHTNARRIPMNSAAHYSQRFLHLGSRLVTLALLPFALGISLEIYVATWKLVSAELIAAMAATITFSMLTVLWYVVPLLYRRQPV
jgi:hypothetical protein